MFGVIDSTLLGMQKYGQKVGKTKKQTSNIMGDGEERASHLYTIYYICDNYEMIVRPRKKGEENNKKIFIYNVITIFAIQDDTQEQ